MTGKFGAGSSHLVIKGMWLDLQDPTRHRRGNKKTVIGKLPEKMETCLRVHRQVYPDDFHPLSPLLSNGCLCAVTSEAACTNTQTTVSKTDLLPFLLELPV